MGQRTREWQYLCNGRECRHLCFAQVEFAVYDTAPNAEIHGHRWIDGKKVLEISFFPRPGAEAAIGENKEALIDVPGILECLLC